MGEENRVCSCMEFDEVEDCEGDRVFDCGVGDLEKVYD